MNPRRWWRTAATADALGPRPVKALATLAKSIVADGPNLFSVVRWRAAASPDQAAIIDTAGSLTYAALVRASEEMAQWLIANGVTTTTPRVAVFCRRPRNAILVVLAGQRLGVGVVLLNTLASTDEVDRLAADRGLIVVSDDPDVGSILLPTDAQLPPVQLPPVRLPSVRLRRAPTIAILTSGSTGQPKLVDKRPPIAAIDTVAAFVDSIGAHRGDRVCLMLPVFHGHGLATVGLSLALGGTLILRPPDEQRADGFRSDWAAIEAGTIDIVVAVPTVLTRLLRAEPDHGDTAMPSVRAIVSGSAPIDAATVGDVTERFGKVLHNVYGSTEAGVISHAGPDELVADPTTVGRPLQGVECDIRPLDQNPGDDIDRGDIGEVWVRGGMAGSDWLRTHDLGAVDDAGRLHLHGRVDSVLVIGGEKIAPETLEARIDALGGVAECAVRGIPDDEYGTRVELLVVPKPDATVDAIRVELDDALPRTLRPVSIVVVDRLPRTALGKLQRRSLAALG